MTLHSSPRRSTRPLFRAFLALTLGLLAWISSPSSAHAQNLIKRPGAHNAYQYEIEPHIGVRWGRWNGANGFGPGLRVGIPLMHNGPIDTINNNIAISFGLDTYFINGGSVGWSTPVAFQWNFYFTDVVSVLGEVGLVPELYTGSGPAHFEIVPLFQGGGRFQFGKVGILVRMGYPGASVGLNLQF